MVRLYVEMDDIDFDNAVVDWDKVEIYANELILHVSTDEVEGVRGITLEFRDLDFEKLKDAVEQAVEKATE